MTYTTNYTENEVVKLFEQTYIENGAVRWRNNNKVVPNEIIVAFHQENLITAKDVSISKTIRNKETDIAIDEFLAHRSGMTSDELREEEAKLKANTWL